MIVSIEAKDGAGHQSRHVLDVGDGYGRDPVLALELLRVGLMRDEWPMVGDVGGQVVRLGAGSFRQIAAAATGFASLTGSSSRPSPRPRKEQVTRSEPLTLVRKSGCPPSA
jgi:hypothetical protein